MIIQDTNRIKKYFVDALNAGEKFEEVNPEFNPRAEINNSRISQYFSTPETETEQKIFVQFTVKIKRKNFSSNPQNRIEKYFTGNQRNFSTQNFNRLKISVLVEFKTAQGSHLHKYLYCANDPINKIDYNGHFFNLVDFSVANTIQGLLRKIAVDMISDILVDNTVKPFFNAVSNFAAILFDVTPAEAFDLKDVSGAVTENSNKNINILPKILFGITLIGVSIGIATIITKGKFIKKIGDIINKTSKKERKKTLEELKRAKEWAEHFQKNSATGEIPGKVAKTIEKCLDIIDGK